MQLRDDGDGPMDGGWSPGAGVDFMLWPTSKSFGRLLPAGVLDRREDLLAI